MLIDEMKAKAKTELKNKLDEAAKLEQIKKDEEEKQEKIRLEQEKKENEERAQRLEKLKNEKIKTDSTSWLFSEEYKEEDPDKMGFLAKKEFKIKQE